ncbi:membrane-bound alpha-1,6- mannosyltransferase Initiation-specific [Tulasnella sp. JGI-2019a]|nr:membrane-bound alpha-1,6- mannosyltransferase Initiation-specific [Tulasnella sp. JGI-2019a]
MATYGPTPLTILPLSNPLTSAKRSGSGSGSSSSSSSSSGARRRFGRSLTFIIACGLAVHILIFWKEGEFRTYLCQTVSFSPRKPVNNPHATISKTFNTTASATGIDKEGSDEDHVAVALEAGPTGRKPLTTLGFRADESYKLGSTIPLAYRYELTSFIRSSFPYSLQPLVQANLDLYFPLGEAGNPGPMAQRLPAMINNTNVWQTNKQQTVDLGGWIWRNEDWKWNMLDDVDAAKWVRERLGESEIEKMWNDLPTGILKADFLRYLLVFFHGGVYSDTDTICLRPIEEWGASADLWSDRDGNSWLPSIREGESPEDRKAALGPPSVIIGVEVDVGDREDWYRWWPRPLQIVQWTFAAAPHHPIFIDVISRVASATARAKAWSEDRDKRVEALQEAGKVDEAKALASIPVHDNGDNGGHMSVMEWTGPGVFTDAVFRYLEARYGVTWPALRMLERPLRVGDVLILPRTGFSPGMNGANPPSDPQAMVQHQFLGSWKGND